MAEINNSPSPYAIVSHNYTYIIRNVQWVFLCTDERIHEVIKLCEHSFYRIRERLAIHSSKLDLLQTQEDYHSGEKFLGIKITDYAKISTVEPPNADTFRTQKECPN